MKFEASDRIKFASAVLAAAILSSGLTLGLYKVGGGLAARAGNAITVTGTASEDAKADFFQDIKNKSLTVVKLVRKKETIKNKW